MPPFECFRDAESYYSALAHELTHWTKHPLRLARDFGRKQCGDEGYAQEELVAELGAAFLCAHLELAGEPRENNASYIANWLEVLKNDTRFIFKAAAHAQRAAEYLGSFGRGKDATAVTNVDDCAEAVVDCGAGSGSIGARMSATAFRTKLSIVHWIVRR